MRVKQRVLPGEENQPGRIIRVVLFFTVWLFLVFVGKRVLGSPRGDLAFIIGNVLTFGCSVIITGIMLHFYKGIVVKISIPAMWFVTILVILY